jgi:nucleotide-binding universal stress UspA family protein
VASKLIIGYDGTPQGDDAVALGRLLAQALGYRAVLATVVPFGPGLAGRADEKVLADARQRLEQVAEERMGGADVEIDLVANRSPARGLYLLATEHSAGAIVVGSTHKGAVGRVVRGSVGENLLNGAPCAVAVAPRGYGAEEEHRLLRLGVGYDGTEESRAALAAAISLAERFHARLAITAVAEPAPMGYGAALAVMSAGDWEAYEVEAKQTVLDEALEAVPADLPVEGRIRRGSAVRELVEASSELDLLLLGSRGYGPVRRVVLGSTAAGVVDAAHCPVMVLARGAGADPLGLAPATETEE